MADLSQYTDEQLAAMLQEEPPKRDLSHYSDAELKKMMQEHGDAALQQAASKGNPDKTPEWASKYPNTYATVMTAADLIPMAAGAIKSSPIGIGTAGLLNVAGQAFKRYQDGETPTLGEAVKHSVGDFVMGAGPEGAGRAVTAVAPALARKLTNTESLGAAADFAARTGVEMTPATVTGSPFLGGLEQFLYNSPASKNRMAGEYNGLLRGYTDDVITPLLTQSLKEKAAAGSVGNSAIEANSQTARNAATKLYDEITKFVTPDTRLPDTNIKQTAKTLLGQQEALQPSFRDKELIAQLQDLVASDDTGIKFTTARALDSKLASIVRGGSNGSGAVAGQTTADTGAYKLLRKSLAQDIESFTDTTADPQLKAALQKANEFYRTEVKDVFNTPLVRSIAKNNPEKLIDLVFTPNSATNVENFRKAVGPKAFEQVKQTWLESMLRQGGTVGDEVVQPSSIDLVLRRFDDGTLKAIFNGKNELKEIRKVANQGKMLTEAFKSEGNPSGTAKNLIFSQGLGSAFGALGGAVLGGAGGSVAGAVAGSVASLAAPALLAKMYLSPVGRKLAIEGMKIPPNTQRAASWAARVGTKYGMDKVSDLLGD